MPQTGKFEILGNLTGGLSTRNAPLLVESNAELAMKSPSVLNADFFVGGSVRKRLGKTEFNTASLGGAIMWAEQTSITAGPITPDGTQNIGGDQAMQAVVAPSSQNIYSITFYLQQPPSPTQFIYLQAFIMSSSGGSPTGTILASSNTVSNANSIPIGGGTLTFTFSTPFAVTSGTTYFFGLQWENYYSNGQGINFYGAFSGGASNFYGGPIGGPYQLNLEFNIYYVIDYFGSTINGLYNFNVSSTGYQAVMAAGGGCLAYSPISGGTSWTNLLSGFGSVGTWAFTTFSNYLFSTDYATNTPQIWNSSAGYMCALGFRVPLPIYTPSTSGGSIPNGVYTIMYVTTLKSGGYRASSPISVIVGGTSSGSIAVSGLVISGTGSSDFGFDIGASATTIWITSGLLGGIYYQVANSSISVGNPLPNSTTSFTITGIPAGTENTLVEAYSQQQQYFTQQVSTPLTKYFCTFNNMICSAGDPNNPCRVWFSQLEAPQIWSTWGGILGNYIDFGLNDGEFITGMGIWNGNLYVFKRHSVYMVQYTSTATNPFYSQQLPSNMGCLSHWTINDLGSKGLIFMSEAGPYICLGTYVIPLPATQEILDRFNLSYSTSYNMSVMNIGSSSVNPTKSQIFFNVATNGSTTFNRTLVFDYEKQAFWENDTVASMYARSLDANYFIHTLSADYAGYVYTQDSGSNDNGTSINWYLYTPELQLGDPFYLKTLDGVYVAGSVQSSGTLYCDVYTENAATPVQTLVFDMTNQTFKSGQLRVCGQQARMFQLCFRNNDLDVPVEIDSIGLDWTQKGRAY